MGEVLNNSDCIYAEVNDEELYQGCALIEDVDTYLDAAGFKRVATHMTSCHWGDAMYVKARR